MWHDAPPVVDPDHPVKRGCERWQQEQLPPALEGVPAWIQDMRDYPASYTMKGSGGWLWSADYREQVNRGDKKFWILRGWNFDSPPECDELIGSHIRGYGTGVDGKVNGTSCVFYK